MNRTKKTVVIDRILVLLANGRRMSQGELVRAIGSRSSAVSHAIKMHRRDGGQPRIRVAARPTLACNGVSTPVYEIGDKPDVPMPKAMAKRIARRVQTLTGKVRGAGIEADDDDDSPSAIFHRAEAVERANRAIEHNLARLRPLAGNVWGVCVSQVVPR